MSTSGVFVTGTDTGVGKTLISSWLCLHWAKVYWKPIQSGLDGPTDTETVVSLSGIEALPERHRLQAPLSPHHSAALEGKTLRLSDFQRPALNKGPLLVEGAGGLLVPINDEHTVLDLIAHLNLPVLLVARSGLGTINHTCLSLMALNNRRIPVVGVVLNGPPNPGNKAAIEHFGQVPVLAEFAPLQSPSAQSLRQRPLPILLQSALDSLA